MSLLSITYHANMSTDTWILVGLAARMATGIGLHTVSTYDNIPTDVAERRKRVFFSIYMMDR